MKPGELGQIIAMTCPMYKDMNTSHIGYANSGTLCLFLESKIIGNVNSMSSEITFYRVLTPDNGPVWVRDVWVKGF
jgi:hypothetical protein